MNFSTDTGSLCDLDFLVVEDDEFQRDVISRLLRRLGARSVQGAQDGAAALRFLQDDGNDIDILVLDLAMPGMDGVELMKQLGNTNRPIGVVLNSRFDPAFMETAAFMGTEYHANVLGAAGKPLTREALMPLLDRYRAARATTVRTQPERRCA
jgi:CheY-like chemotaxis protein